MMVWLHFGLQYAKCKIWINDEFRESYYIKKLTLSHCFKLGQKKKQNKTKNKDILRFEIDLIYFLILIECQQNLKIEI